MAAFYVNHRTIFITIIPLIKRTELMLHNIILIPVTIPTTSREIKVEERNFLILDPETSYIAITKKGKQYILFDENQTSKCTSTKIVRICSTHQPVLQNKVIVPYELILFSKPKSMSQNKKYNLRSATIHRNIFHKLKYSNEWIYTIKDDDLTIIC